MREGEVMGHGLLVLVLVLIRVVGGVQGEGRVDLGGTRGGHVGLWMAVVVVVHGGGVEVVLRIGRQGHEGHFGGRCGEDLHG